MLLRQFLSSVSREQTLKVYPVDDFRMVNIQIYALLTLVVLALFSQTCANAYAIDDDSLIGNHIRVRRAPNHHPGVTGPVHTFVKTDKHANFKWGVRHHVGHKYAGGN